MKRFSLAVLILSFSTLASAAEKSKELDGSSYGDAWPLTFTSAKVSCVNRLYVFVYNTATDERYPVNGTAKNAVRSGKLEGSDIDEVWRKSNQGNGQRVNIGPILDEGFALCDR
ncbi:DUF2511 domain-containing protein [Pantoea sp. JGM49]|uniref:DUF2511 domain-containing protein n=1 Tax=Pantoea sp. JGM49 TaxID=2799791 RepID=UPI001BA6BD51|nr:DUF2511 domain-containing protein [Pantoea sp. JGM49]MBS0880156.1 DUF2511 domain-containing protein [Pantoea sp. JGM49]